MYTVPVYPNILFRLIADVLSVQSATMEKSLYHVFLVFFHKIYHGYIIPVFTVLEMKG